MSGTLAQTGYPWDIGEQVYSSDLNAAFALAYANDAAALAAANSAAAGVAALQASGATPKAASVTLNWPGIAVTPGDYVLTATVPRPITVTSVDVYVGSAGGSLTVNIRAAGVTIGGYGALTINQSVKTNIPAVAGPSNPLTVGVGSLLDVVVQVTAGIPIDAYICLNYVRTS